MDHVPPPTGEDIAQFLGQGDDPAVVALAGEHAPIVRAMAQAYTRGKGFQNGQVTEDIHAVLVAATARLVANPEQMSWAAGSARVSGAFRGWTLAETFVLNRYRKRAM
ncbi:hypothetical protein [Nesterenkonia natronophila]|uniref:Uncharacterized protein n=1 Tax=Nesterenkonia natronophila TaxID=2174932 RepID=A0A3A4FDP0_9MICC|nr:hypothetical protein [Nesterenkonia natronophila]RJN32904.1 hypothetical protein D3250_03570 [Nesterenkonia natronophila]